MRLQLRYPLPLSSFKHLWFCFWPEVFSRGCSTSGTLRVKRILKWAENILCYTYDKINWAKKRTITKLLSQKILIWILGAIDKICFVTLNSKLAVRGEGVRLFAINVMKVRHLFPTYDPILNHPILEQNKGRQTNFMVVQVPTVNERI